MNLKGSPTARLYGEQNGIALAGAAKHSAAKIEEIELLIQSRSNARLLQRIDSLLHNQRENLSMELKLMSSA